MQNIVNYFKGNVRIEVEGAYPERFMNLCGSNGVTFWDLERVSEVTIRVTMTIGSYKKIRPLVGGAMCSIKPVKKAGAPFFLWRIRKRYALLAGMLLTLAAIWVLSLYIWEIDVVGNEEVNTAEILQTLEQLGVSVGSYTPAIDQEAVRNEMLLELDGLLWMTININGSKATVIVKERLERPEILDEDTPTSVYATKTGIIEKITVLDGVALSGVGDTVMQGEDIVSGVVESLSSGTRFVSARASVTARTWYELSMKMPLELAEKSYTGTETSKTTVIFAGKRINLYFNSGISYSSYDKIVNETNPALPGGIVLPITIRTNTYKEYETAYSLLSEEAAEKILQERLQEELSNLMTESGEIIKLEFAAETAGGMITVTLMAECREEIAAVRRLGDEELVIPENADETQEEGGITAE